MASKDSDNIDTKKQEEVDDITTCCICTEVYTDPKALPCIHTFCLKCIQETGLKTVKGPGDEMPCPICRRQFKIPAEGFNGLPKHFFIERLIQLSKVTDISAAANDLCSLCLEETKEQTGSETPTADTYCADCKYKLCKECCSDHKKFKMTKNHKLLPLNEYESSQNVMENLVPIVCEVHEQKILDVYCTDCKAVLCAICFIEEHKNHDGSHVNKCLAGFRKQIESNTEAMNCCIGQAQVKKTEITKTKEEMHQRVHSLESDVERRKEGIKNFTDKHARCLLEGLRSERQSRLKEIQMATDDTDAYISNLESYNSYCQRILDKGSASDICNALSDLSARAIELQEACHTVFEREIPDFRFVFSQSELEEFLNEDGGNLVGEIHEEGKLESKKGKQILLAELSNKIDLLRKEIENERTEKTNLQSTIVQQKIDATKEAQVVRGELIKREATYTHHVEKLKQELDNNKITNNELQLNNTKLKKELDAEKTTNNSLQANNTKLKKELDAEKTTNNSIQVNNDKLVEELKLCKATLKTAETNSKKLMKKPDEQRYSSDPVLVQTIRTKAAVDKQKDIRGLAILDKELFVVSEESSEVEVYDSIKFNFSRQWSFKELIDPCDIASCNGNKCLYISYHKSFSDKSNAIFRFDRNGNVIKNWSTGDKNGWLSVTDEMTIIFASYVKNKLHEYSSDGLLIHEINLSSTAGIRHPWHAIKLSNGNFVISHGSMADEYHRVCLLDADGSLKKSFGGQRGSAIGQLNCPIYLSVDANGSVMVADRENNRVLLLDSDLKLRKEIHSGKVERGLKYPGRILVDESNGRFFVAYNATYNQRILIFD